LIYEYKPDRFSDLIDRILKNLDNHPEKLFGIIVPNNQVREQYYDALKNSTCQLDHGHPRIETYANGKQPNLLFNEGGIMVINAQSCKGLEFDTVFLADINEHLCNPSNLDHIKRLFYVMVARARDQVVMLKEAGKHCPVEAILPKDTNVLERK
jgi:superfamily I DNA/RNA helicase